MELFTGNLEKIAEHGKRADNIVKSMLEHARGVSGERREVDLNGMIEEALNLAYHGARAQDQSFNITLERDYASTLKPIELAPQEMTWAFLNLFGNGFYAATTRARDGGDSSYRPSLTVATREDGDAVEVRVRDNGTGILPEIRDRMFQLVLHDKAHRRGHRPRPFDQLRHRRPTAWRHDHGRERTGGVHRVRLPPATPLVSTLGEGMSVSSLVVDDEPDVALLFRQRFRHEAREGTYVMHFANSGEITLEQLAAGVEPTLIVIRSDINMPGMDGLALLREIKAQRPDLPVMMVTAYGDDERRRRASDLGELSNAAD